MTYLWRFIMTQCTNGRNFYNSTSHLSYFLQQRLLPFLRNTRKPATEHKFLTHTVLEAVYIQWVRTSHLMGIENWNMTESFIPIWRFFIWHQNNATELWITVSINRWCGCTMSLLNTWLGGWNLVYKEILLSGREVVSFMSFVLSRLPSLNSPCIVFPTSLYFFFH
jgi:hypothetical protein